MDLDDVYAEKLRRWEVETIMDLLVHDGFNLPTIEALEASEAARAAFWFAVARHFASKLEARLRRPERDVVWTRAQLHRLLADYWFEEARTGDTQRAITERLATAPEYHDRWGGYGGGTLRDKLQDAFKDDHVQAVLSDTTGQLKAVFVRALSLLSAAD